MFFPLKKIMDILSDSEFNKISITNVNNGKTMKAIFVVKIYDAKIVFSKTY
jgi:hypothetical protein